MSYLKSEMHFMKCETKKTRHLRLPFRKGHAHAENCSYMNSVFPCHSSDDKGGNRCRNNGRRPPHCSISEIGVQGYYHARLRHGYTNSFHTHNHCNQTSNFV